VKSRQVFVLLLCKFFVERGIQIISNIFRSYLTFEQKENIFCYSSKSFIWSTIGYTCVSFTIGALAWWSPEFGLYSVRLHSNPNAKMADVSYKFGIVTFVAGVIGVTLGAEIARRWRHTNMQADALVCAFGLLGGIPFVFVTLYIFDKQTNVAWVSIHITVFEKLKTLFPTPFTLYDNGCFTMYELKVSEQIVWVIVYNAPKMCEKTLRSIECSV